MQLKRVSLALALLLLAVVFWARIVEAVLGLTGTELRGLRVSWSGDVHADLFEETTPARHLLLRDFDLSWGKRDGRPFIESLRAAEIVFEDRHRPRALLEETIKTLEDMKPANLAIHSLSVGSLVLTLSASSSPLVFGGLTSDEQGSLVLSARFTPEIFADLKAPLVWTSRLKSPEWRPDAASLAELRRQFKAQSQP